MMPSANSFRSGSKIVPSTNTSMFRRPSMKNFCTHHRRALALIASFAHGSHSPRSELLPYLSAYATVPPALCQDLTHILAGEALVSRHEMNCDRVVGHTLQRATPRV